MAFVHFRSRRRNRPAVVALGVLFSSQNKTAELVAQRSDWQRQWGPCIELDCGLCDFFLHNEAPFNDRFVHAYFDEVRYLVDGRLAVHHALRERVHERGVMGPTIEVAIEMEVE